MFHFLDGGSETEATLRRNTDAFDRIPLVSRCFVDVSNVVTRTRLLGQEINCPLICSPTGGSRFFHPLGELAVARAAARAGILYCVSAGSTYSLEDIAAANPAPKVFLLFPFKNRDVMWGLLERSRQAGYTALCLMADVPAVGKRERDLRTGFATWARPSLARTLHCALHPNWAFGQIQAGRITFPNFSSQADTALPEIDAAMSWREIRAIADRWGGPFAIKGIMRADDARRAADAGATAILVSNHGGRQLDGAAAPIEVLPEIVTAVKDRLEIILDGGVRRGTHVLKALACGATACSTGRSYLYGLGAAGEEGAFRALDILREEFELAMKLTGCATLQDVDETLIRKAG